MTYIQTPVVEGSNTVGFKPKRLLPESKKTASWAKEMADWCIANSNITYDPPQKRLYNMFNGERDLSQFNYITKTFGIEFPAKIKHIPLIRPRLNRLIGEEQERVLEYDLISVDTNAINFKKEQMFQIALRAFMRLMTGEIDEEEYMKTGKYLQREFKVNFEIGAHKALEEYIYAHRLHEKFADGFKDRLITGEENYRVRVDRIGEDPKFEVISPMDIYHSPNEVDWISECDWAVHVKRMSSTEIVDAYGEMMTDEEIEKLTNQQDLYAKQAMKVRTLTEMDEVLDNRQMDPDYYMNYDDDLWDVYEVEFKAIRSVNIRVSPNKYDPEKPFIKVLTDEEVLELPAGRQKQVQKRYMEELWRVTRVGVDIYPKVGRVKTAERNTREPSKVYLTFEGQTFSKNIKPFSLVDVTWDLQMLYDILHFHKENLIAMSGTRGAVIDLAKMPDFGHGFDTQDGFMKNLQMFLYYKKMGALFVDSRRDERGYFNQAGTYDDTLGNGLVAVLDAIRHIEETAGEVISINRQRMGQGITPRDGQKVNQDALEQSSLATEPIYNDHDNTKERILAKILNAGKIAWKNGKNGAFMDRHLEQQVFTLEPEFSTHDYNLFLSNKYQSRKRLEDLKGLMMQLSVNGQANSSTAIDVLLATSLKEVEVMLKEDISKAEEQMQMMQQQQAQLEQQSAMAESQAKQAELQMKLQELQADMALKQQEIALKERELNAKIDYDKNQLQLERERVNLERLQLELSSNAKEVKND